MIAFLVAGSIASGVGLALANRLILGRWGVADSMASAAGVALIIMALFVILWGYHVFFELAWNGQTPGKRAVGLRVLTTAGQPITFAHVLVRNLLRIVDFLPSSYMLGAVVMLITRRSQRLGDLAAGTIVVKERREAAPSRLLAQPDAPELPLQETAELTAEDVALAREFMQRRWELDPLRRRELAARIASRIRPHLGPVAAQEPAESLLARIAALKR